MSGTPTWHNLELHVAEYFIRNGYEARTNQKELGRDGLLHEIDVLATKTDAAGTHRVAVECKAWKSRIEKEVIYKLQRVMQETGLTKGIVVSTGGLTSGAKVAADQAHIDVWGPDEIRHLLGEAALTGLPTVLAEHALGYQPTITAAAAEQAVTKASRGFAGFGGEDVGTVDLMWLPAVEFQVAITRIQPGLIRDREELVRRWILFELVGGRMLGHRESARSFVEVSIAFGALRPQKSSATITGDMKRTIAKHRDARGERAQGVRQKLFNAIGLPGSTRDFVIESETVVYLPFYVGSLSRKNTERLVAIHAQQGVRFEDVESSLHEHVDAFRTALGSSKHARPVVPAASGNGGVDFKPSDTRATKAAPTCRCGAVMVERHRKSDGAPFWGCPTFPRCRHIRPFEPGGPQS